MNSHRIRYTQYGCTDRHEAHRMIRQMQALVSCMTTNGRHLLGRSRRLLGARGFRKSRIAAWQPLRVAQIQGLEGDQSWLP